MKQLALNLPGNYNIEHPVNFKFNAVGGQIGPVISELLPYVFVLAGLLLGIFLIAGGLELLTSAGDPEGVKKGQGKVTSAIVGFIIVFLSYWIVQLLEKILGINILAD